MSNIGNILKRLREENNLTGKEAVEKLKEFGIDISAKTLYGYESGRNSTNADMFLALCKIYKCQNVMSIFSDSTDEVLFTNKEWEMIEKYRFISTNSTGGATVVDTVLDREYAIAQQLEGKDNEIKELKKELIPKRVLAYYGKIAAAGKSYGFEDVLAGTIEFPLTDESQRADYAIGVSGDSMEPTYFDGDIVYVSKNARPGIGDIGIFQKDNGIYIKEVGENELISHNTEYKPMVNNGDILCLGKVIGKVEET